MGDDATSLAAREYLNRLEEVEADGTALGSAFRAGAEWARSSGLRLTPREIEVLRLLAAGTPEDGIATALVVTRSTVRTYLARILKKLGVHSRRAALAVAIKHGYLPDRRNGTTVRT